MKTPTLKELRKMSLAEFIEHIKECQKDPEFMKEIKQFIKDTT